MNIIFSRKSVQGTEKSNGSLQMTSLVPSQHIWGRLKRFSWRSVVKRGSQPHGTQEGSKSPAIRPAEMRNPSLESHSLRNTWLPRCVRVSFGREAGISCVWMISWRWKRSRRPKQIWELRDFSWNMRISLKMPWLKSMTHDVPFATIKCVPARLETHMM